MSRIALAALALTAAVATASDPPQSPADKLAAVRKQVADAEAEFYKAAKALPETPEGEKKNSVLYAEFDKVQQAGFAAAVEIAKADPKSDAGFAALEWVLTTPRAYYVAAGIPAMELMAEHHAANPKVDELVTRLGALTPHPESYPKEHAAAVALFRAVAEKNPDRATRGQAAFALARQADTRFQFAEYRKHPDTEALAAEAERQFTAVEKDYGDCELQAGGSTRTLGEVAWANLFELRNLRVGKVAPDIAGEDLDGTRFKLSDSRGKVTVLVFWGTWCGPCMRLVPHEKKLAERFAGRPFTLVGVDRDDDRAEAKRVAAEKGMTWRSFWNDAGPEPISRTWNVSGWPTVYVLDHAGVIRFKENGPGRWEDEIEKLVAAAEAAKK